MRCLCELAVSSSRPRSSIRVRRSLAPLPAPAAGGRGAPHERPREARGTWFAIGRRAEVRTPRALGESAVPNSLLGLWHDPSQGSGTSTARRCVDRDGWRSRAHALAPRGARAACSRLVRALARQLAVEAARQSLVVFLASAAMSCHVASSLLSALRAVRAPHPRPRGSRSATPARCGRRRVGGRTWSGWFSPPQLNRGGLVRCLCKPTISSSRPRSSIRSRRSLAPPRAGGRRAGRAPRADARHAVGRPARGDLHASRSR